MTLGPALRPLLLKDKSARMILYLCGEKAPELEMTWNQVCSCVTSGEKNGTFAVFMDKIESGTQGYNTACRDTDIRLKLRQDLATSKTKAFKVPVLMVRFAHLIANVLRSMVPLQLPAKDKLRSYVTARAKDENRKFSFLICDMHMQSAEPLFRLRTDSLGGGDAAWCAVKQALCEEVAETCQKDLRNAAKAIRDRLIAIAKGKYDALHTQLAVCLRHGFA